MHFIFKLFKRFVHLRTQTQLIINHYAENKMLIQLKDGEYCYHNPWIQASKKKYSFIDLLKRISDFSDLDSSFKAIVAIAWGYNLDLEIDKSFDLDL